MASPEFTRIVAVGYAVGAAFCMAAMDAAGKLAVLEAPVAQVIALRAAFVLALGWPMIRAAGIGATLRTRHPWIHGVRAVAILASMLSFLVGVRAMPLANATAIGLSAPLFMLVFASLVLGEAIRVTQILAAIIGFAGVLVVMGAGLGGAGWGPTALMVGSAASFGLSMVLVRRLAGADGDATLLLYSNLGVLFAGALAVPATIAPMSGVSWLMIAAMAALMFAGQLATYRAFRRASVATLAPVQYAELIFAAALGWLIWREAAGPEIWLGGALIVAGGALAIRRPQENA